MESRPKTPRAFSLRARFIFYLGFMHALLAGLAVLLFLRHRWLLLAIEAVFILSLSIGVQLIRRLFGTIELINSGAQFLEENDLTSRFRETGQSEMDRLISVYNRMIDSLRQERTRQQEQNFFLEKLLRASPSGVITLDFDGRIAMLNPAAEKMLAQTAGELIGKRLTSLQTPLALESIALGESQILPLRGRRLARCRRSQFMDRGFARDFILLEEMTEELRQAEKSAYEKVIRLMSHEVNNSVGSANSLLHSSLHYAVQLRTEDRDDFVTAIKVVIDRTEHLNAFMRNFADVFRLPRPKLEPTDLPDLLKSLGHLFREQMESRRIGIRYDFQPEPMLVELDRLQIEQALVNLMKNAMEAIGARGVIILKTGCEDGRNFMAIVDSGRGVSAAAQAHLFTPFFSDKENGQGIGLTLVQEILDQHGFEYSLESRAGGPTEFRIYF